MAVTRNPLFAGLQIQKGRWVDQWRFTAHGYSTEAAAIDAVLAIYPIGYAHNTKPMFVTGAQITQVIAPNSAYEVGLNYEQPEGGGGSNAGGNSAADLLALPAVVESIDPYLYPEPCEVDIYGKPITNTAGDPFDPPGTTDRSGQIIVISKWKEGYLSSTYENFFGALNNATVTLAGVGACNARTVRCLSVKPANSFVATMVVPYDTMTGTISVGQTVTWTGGGSGVVSAVSGSTLTIINPTKSVALSTVISNGSGGSITATAAVTLPPVKTLWTFDRRKLGFDYKQIDKGFRAWHNDGPKLSRVCDAASASEVAAPVDLENGTVHPALQSSTTVVGGNFTGWTNANKLAARIALSEVDYTTSTTTATGEKYVKFLKFKRIDQVDFSGIGL